MIAGFCALFTKHLWILTHMWKCKECFNLLVTCFRSYLWFFLLQKVSWDSSDTLKTPTRNLAAVWSCSYQKHEDKPLHSFSLYEGGIWELGWRIDIAKLYQLVGIHWIATVSGMYYTGESPHDWDILEESLAVFGCSLPVLSCRRWSWRGDQTGVR